LVIKNKIKIISILGPKDMIEADIVLGFLDRDQSPTQLMPIMAHPPNNKSDLSLKEFLDTIGRARVEKGVKLDFKSIEAFKASEKIIEDFFNEANVIKITIDGGQNFFWFLSSCLFYFPSDGLSSAFKR
jgi:hypothetical protein